MLRNKSSSSNNRKRANCNNLKNKIRTFMKTSITMRVTVTTDGKSNGIWCLTRLGSPYSQRWSQRLHDLQSHTAFAHSTQVMNDQPHKIRKVGMHIIHTLMPKQIFIAKAYLVLHQIKTVPMLIVVILFYISFLLTHLYDMILQKRHDFGTLLIIMCSWSRIIVPNI